VLVFFDDIFRNKDAFVCFNLFILCSIAYFLFAFASNLFYLHMNTFYLINSINHYIDLNPNLHFP